MLSTSISDFRKDIKSYFDRVTDNFETLIINRGKDKGVVIMSLAEYNSFLSTQHELSSKENERRLDSAIEKLKMMEKKFKLLDTVAILREMPQHRVLLGQVGTIVEILSDVDYEVEFSDKNGESIAEFSFTADDLLLLHHSLEYSPK